MYWRVEDCATALGVVIFNEGDPGDSFYIIMHGTVTVRIGGQEGSECAQLPCAATKPGIQSPNGDVGLGLPNMVNGMCAMENWITN